MAIANRDPRIHFAILSDFADADTEHVPGEERLLEVARAGIDDLNARLGGINGPHFAFLHRSRLWNPREQVWMGWERKRGKLEEFNRLLRGADRHQLHDPRRVRRRAARHSLRDHARLRHAAAARHRARS